MSNYTLHIQKTKTGKFRVCLVSADNGKLVMQGEPLVNRKDASAIFNNILNTYSMGGSPIMEGSTLRPDHKFVKNSGPKKKAVRLKFRVDNPVGYKDIAIRRTTKKK